MRHSRIRMLPIAAWLAVWAISGPVQGAAVPADAAGPADAAPLNKAGEGRRLYLKLNCYGCHGMYAAGGMGPNITHTESGDIREAVLQGEEGGMRSFRTYVSDKDIKRLQAYFKSIGTAKEPKFKDWWVDIPPK